MSLGVEIAGAVGGGIGASMLLFPLTYIAMKGKLFAPFSDMKIAMLFFVTCLVMGITKLFIPRNVSPYWEVFASLLLPILVSALVIKLSETKSMQSTKGKTVLILAVESSDIEKVKQIVANDPELLDAQDDTGGTALHYAILCKNKEITIYLLDSGASLSIATKKGRDALYIAEKVEWDVGCSILKSRMSPPDSVKSHSSGVTHSSGVRSFNIAPLHCKTSYLAKADQIRLSCEVEPVVQVDADKT